MKIDKILFYYPSRIVGGTEYLFKRCSEYLAENQNEYKILYADYPDGFVRKNIKSDKVHFVEIGSNKEVYVEDGTAVILQLNIIYQLFDRIIFDYNKSLCLFWCLHRLNIKNAIFAKNFYWISRKSRKRLGRSLYSLTNLNVVKFMNYHGCYNFFKDFWQIPKVFEWLPNIAPIKRDMGIECFDRISKEVWNFCWLGRLDVEKAKNIETYMNELEALNITNPLTLYIIGNGPKAHYLKSIAPKYSYPIEFVGEKREEDLDKFIREKVEIGLASGTSAFEFALRGKPVIMEWEIKQSYRAGKRSTYTFNYEDELYDFSRTDKLVRMHEDFFSNKAEIIFNNYNIIAENEYKFVLSKSVEICSQKLIDSIQQISNYNPIIVNTEIKVVDNIINKGRRRIKAVYSILHPFIN